MEVSVEKIGNSKGIRLSKTLIERYNIKDSVELVPEKDQIIIKPLTKPRRNWETAFREMNANGDDHLLVSDILRMKALMNENKKVRNCPGKS